MINRTALLIAASLGERKAVSLMDRDPASKVGQRERALTVATVSRADQRELFLVGDGEDDAAVLVLEEIGARIVEFLAHDDVAALDEADIVHVVLPDRG